MDVRKIFGNSAPDAAPGKTLAELEKAAASAGEALAAAEGVLAQLQSDHADELHDLEQLGFEAARPNVEALARRVQDQTRLIERKRAARDTAAAAIATERQQRAQREAWEREASIPVLARQRMMLAAEVQLHAEKLGAALNAMLSNGNALGAAIGTADAIRVFGFNGLGYRVQHTFAGCFTVADQTSKKVLEMRGNAAPVRWFPYQINGAEALCKMMFVDSEQRTVDEYVRVFGTMTDAEAARRRLEGLGAKDVEAARQRLEALPQGAPGGGVREELPDDAIARRFHVLSAAPSGLFHLVPGRLKGKTARAATAPAPGGNVPAPANTAAATVQNGSLAQPQPAPRDEQEDTAARREAVHYNEQAAARREARDRAPPPPAVDGGTSQ